MADIRVPRMHLSNVRVVVLIKSQSAPHCNSRRNPVCPGSFSEDSHEVNHVEALTVAADPEVASLPEQITMTSA